MTQPVQPSGSTSAARPTVAGSMTVPGREDQRPPVTGLGAPEPTAPVSSTAPPPAGAPKRRSGKSQRRHARVVIRKISPWSVFKVSVVFYLCMMLVMLGAGMIVYGMLGAIGALDSTTRLIRDLFAEETFVINGRWLFSRGLMLGLLMVVVWSLINVFVVFLYNLISDLVGGVEITLAERR